MGSLRDFERFLRACALRSANLLNKADLARDVGIAPSTANHWLSMLEASGQIVLLEPWFSNRTKSIVKSPKLYLADTGLLCALLNCCIVRINLRVIAFTRDRDIGHAAVEQILSAQLGVQPPASAPSRITDRVVVLPAPAMPSKPTTFSRDRKISSAAWRCEVFSSGWRSSVEMRTCGGTSMGSLQSRRLSFLACLFVLTVVN